MSARFVDALKGYEFFIQSRGEVSREKVNIYLRSIGRKEISLRTYEHYGKLRSHGFEGYIPINKFDVFQSLGRIQMVSDRRGYPRAKLRQDIQISKDGKKWSNCIAVDKSPVGLGIRTCERFPVSPRSNIWVRMADHYDFPTILVWRRHTNTHTRLGLRALEFISKFREYETIILPDRMMAILRLSGTHKSVLKWSELYRAIETLDRLLDSADALVYSVADASGTEIELAPSLLSSIEFKSPGDAQIKIDFGIADILEVIFNLFRPKKLEKERLKAEITHNHLRNTGLALDVVRKAIDLKRDYGSDEVAREAARLLGGPLSGIFGQIQLPEDLFEPDRLETGILRDRLLPAAAELMAGDDSEFDVDIDKDVGALTG